MAWEQSDLENRVYSRTGLDPTTELSASIVDDAIDSAMTEFNRHKPKKVWGTTPIQTNVQDYAFPTFGDPPITPFTITKFYYAPETILGNISFDETILLLIQKGQFVTIDFSGNIFENPSLVDIFFQKLKSFRDKLGEPDWEILKGAPADGSITGNKVIRLAKIPSNDGTAYWEGLTQWIDCSEVPDEWNETLLNAVLWKVCESRAMALAVANRISESGGVSMEPAFKFWNDKSDTYKTQFMMEIGAYGGVMIIG